MEKRNYLEPEIEVLLIETTALLSGSGVIDENGGEAGKDPNPGSGDDY